MNFSIAIAATTALGAIAMVGALSVPASAQSTCQGEVGYEVTFEGLWPAQSDAFPFPNDPHFSPMVVATHNDQWKSFQVGELASPGIKLMAETGKPTVLKDEWTEAFNAGAVRAFRTGGRIDLGDSTNVTLNVSADRPYLTMVSMIAPSPDWFVAANGHNLCQNGQWLTQAEIDLTTYDAGTDSGPAFASPNQATTPAQPINMDDLPVGTFGKLTIQKV